MLTTLLSQELRTNWRRILAIVVVMSVVGLSAAAASLADTPIVETELMGIALASFLSIPVFIFLLLLIEYWRSLYGKSGYFTFMIPVRGRAIFAAKLLFMILTTVVGTILAIAGCFLTAWMNSQKTSSVNGELLDLVLDALTVLGPWLWVVIPAGIIAVIALIVGLVASLSISSQSRWNHLGLGAPVIGSVLFFFSVTVTAGFMSWVVPLRLHYDHEALLQRWQHRGWLYHEIMGDLEYATARSNFGLIDFGPILAVVILAGLLGWWAVRSIEDHTSVR